MSNGPWALVLPGWEDLSTWGYDDGIGSFYAQLTRNGGNDDNGPEVWITPPRYPAITRSAQLATLITQTTGAAFTDVREALNDAVTSQGAPATFRVS